MPDELIVAGTCAQIEHDPGVEGRVIFFGHKIVEKQIHELTNDFYFNSLYGNGKGQTLVKDKYRDWYDRLMVKIAGANKAAPIMKARQLMKAKHVG